MPLDIDRLSEEELVDLNHRIVERLRFMRQARAHHAMLQFRIGERVWFASDEHGRVEGVIVRYNRTSVSLLAADGRQWRVSPGFLRKCDGEPATEESRVVVLPTRRALPPRS